MLRPSSLDRNLEALRECHGETGGPPTVSLAGAELRATHFLEEVLPAVAACSSEDAPRALDLSRSGMRDAEAQRLAAELLALKPDERRRGGGDDFHGAQLARIALGGFRHCATHMLHTHMLHTHTCYTPATLGEVARERGQPRCQRLVPHIVQHTMHCAMYCEAHGAGVLRARNLV